MAVKKKDVKKTAKKATKTKRKDYPAGESTGGRPTKFQEQFVRMTEVACAEGFSIPKLAKLLGVTKSTVTLWQKENKNFSDAIVKGRDIYDSWCIENALKKKAQGYRYTETFREWDEESQKMKIVRTATKHSLPDTPSMKFWLKNRNPDRWQDKQTIDSNITMSHEEMLDELE